MTPLPAGLEPGQPMVAWRIDAAEHAPHWDSGIGAELGGGRWNPKGVRAVYGSFDPATTILESAVHRGFRVLDTRPFMLSRLAIADASLVKVVRPAEVPNPAWLHAGMVSAGQQAWGAALLAAHAFVVLPSVVSRRSWNLVFRPDVAGGHYRLLAQERLAIDGRLNPAPA